MRWDATRVHEVGLLPTVLTSPRQKVTTKSRSASSAYWDVWVNPVRQMIDGRDSIPSLPSSPVFPYKLLQFVPTLLESDVISPHSNEAIPNSLEVPSAGMI